jgi:hypothetical protein
VDHTNPYEQAARGLRGTFVKTVPMFIENTIDVNVIIARNKR